VFNDTLNWGHEQEIFDVGRTINDGGHKSENMKVACNDQYKLSKDGTHI
jgi:hypothetical protein